MSSFTGVSVITDGKHCTTLAIDAGTDSGYHLVVVKDYSRTIQEIPNGEEISSGPFMVGGLKCAISWFARTLTPRMSVEPDIGQHLDYLLQSKVGAHVTFEVSGETFPAHRCVLAARSTVFMAQLFGPMKEGTTSSVIHIKDIQPKVFRDLLSFIYTGLMPEMDKDNDMEKGKAEVVEEGQEEDAIENVMWLQALFVAADRYDLQRLKLLCEENWSEHIGVSSVASTLALGEQHHCHGLKEACLEFIQVQSPKCLSEILASDGWKNIATTYASVLDELIVKLSSNQKEKKRKHENM